MYSNQTSSSIISYVFKSIKLFHYIFCIQIIPVLPLLYFAFKSLQFFHYYLLHSNQSSSSIIIFCIHINQVLLLESFVFKSIQFFHYYILHSNQSSSSINISCIQAVPKSSKSHKRHLILEWGTSYSISTICPSSTDTNHFYHCGIFQTGPDK